jgi:hypothetical protein
MTQPWLPVIRQIFYLVLGWDLQASVFKLAAVLAGACSAACLASFACNVCWQVVEVVDWNAWGTGCLCAIATCATCFTSLRAESACGGRQPFFAVCLCAGRRVEWHMQDRM